MSENSKPILNKRLLSHASCLKMRFRSNISSMYCTSRLPHKRAITSRFWRMLFFRSFIGIKSSIRPILFMQNMIETRESRRDARHPRGWPAGGATGVRNFGPKLPRRLPRSVRSWEPTWSREPCSLSDHPPSLFRCITIWRLFFRPYGCFDVSTRLDPARPWLAQVERQMFSGDPCPFIQSYCAEFACLAFTKIFFCMEKVKYDFLKMNEYWLKQVQRKIILIIRCVTA